MNYEQMSDFEINKKYLRIVRGHDVIIDELSATTGEAAARKIIGDALVIIDSFSLKNPSHVWPIIDANCISINWDAEINSDAPAKWCSATSLFTDHEIDHQSDGLRAAMIVFLMMKDADTDTTKQETAA